MRPLPVIAALALAIAAAAVGLALARVMHLERRELAFEGAAQSLADWSKAPGSTRVSRRLAEVELRVGERALFELCAADRLERAAFLDAFDVVIFYWPEAAAAKDAKPEMMLRVPLDKAHLAQAQRAESEACLPLGGGIIEQAGRHTFEVVFADKPLPPVIAGIPMRARILARTPLGAVDRGALLALVGAMLALVLALFAMPRDEQVHEASDGLPVNTTAGALAAIGLLASTTFLPLYGSALGLVKGLIIVALQTLAALLLSSVWSEPRRVALGLVRPRRPLLWLVAAPVAAVILALCARVALRVVPSTGEAPIESFVSWPSGLLAFAVIGVIAPVAEELFFRGFLYRLALPLGRIVACAATLVLFVVLHLAQSWGNWGGVLAVALTGAVLTYLRAASDSLLVPALAHVLYNAALSLQAL
jgi:membrane protease YdiL (CAAX protease family)